MIYDTVPRLPDEFQEVEYIESDGNQFINLGIKPNQDTEVEINFQFSNLSGGQYLFGSYVSSPDRFGFSKGGANNLAFNFGNSSVSLLEIADTNEHILSISNGILKYDNTEYNLEMNEFQCSNNLYLFARNYDGVANLYAQIKIKYIKISNNYLIPCYRKSDNVAGMYDLISKQFLTNQGTGEFIVGSDKNTYITKIIERIPEVVRTLPDKYMQLSYIEGNGNQFIKTGYYPNNNTKLIVVCEFTELYEETGTNPYVVGVYGGAENRARLQLGVSKNSLFFGWGTAYNNNVSYSFKTNTTYKIEIANGVLTINDEVVYTLPEEVFQSEQELGLLCINANGEYRNSPSVKLYEYKIEENGKVIQSIIPCYEKETGNIGAYNTTSNKFFISDGTEPFIKGEDIEVLPEEYQRVEYVESTRTQCFLTNIIPKSNQKIRIKANINEPSKNVSIFGSRTSGEWNTSTDQIYMNVQNGAGNFNLGSERTYGLGTLGNSLLFDYTFDITNSTYTNNITGAITAIGNSFDNKASQPFAILSLNNQGEVSSTLIPNAKLYLFQVWEDDILVNNLVPCYRKSDNEIGLYDLVTKEFLTNYGTGTFLKGEDINPLIIKDVVEVWDMVEKLPEEYQEVTYIESTGTQWIDTEVNPTGNTRIEIEVEFTDLENSDRNYVFGLSYDNGNRLQLAPAYASAFFYGYATQYQTNVPYTFENNKKYKVVSDKGKLYIDDILIKEFNYEEFTSDRSFVLFAFKQNTSITRISKMKMHSVKILDNDVLLRDFTPCYLKSDNTAGFYDGVSKRQFVNKGTRTFNVGEDIATYTPKITWCKYFIMTADGDVLYSSDGDAVATAKGG